MTTRDRTQRIVVRVGTHGGTGNREQACTGGGGGSHGDGRTVVLMPWPHGDIVLPGGLSGQLPELIGQEASQPGELDGRDQESHPPEGRVAQGDPRRAVVHVDLGEVPRVDRQHHRQPVRTVRILRDLRARFAELQKKLAQLLRIE